MRGRRITLSISLLLLLFVPVAPVESSAPSLVLLDMDSEQAATHIEEIRETCPSPTRGQARFSIVPPTETGTHDRALRFEYTLADTDPTPVGLRVPLDHLDATTYDVLEVRIRSEAANGNVPPLRIGFRRPEPGGRGLIQTGSFVVRNVSDQWTTLRIPLHSMLGIRDWMDLSDLFFAVEPNPSASRTGAFLLSDFVLRHTGNQVPTADDKPPTPRKRAWTSAAGGIESARRRKQERLRGWPQRLLVPRSELPADDTEFLRRLARDTWQGLDALRDHEHGIPLDTVSFGESAKPDAVLIGDYTNVTNIGLYLLSVAAAYELQLVPEAQAEIRVRLLLQTLEHLETHQGVFFNYYDTTTLERSTNFVSFVDSAWLTAGLIVARSTFPALDKRISKLIDQTNYRFFYDESRGLMSHGVFVHLGLPSEYHYGLLYTEARLGSLIAIGKRDVPEAHWFRMLRVFPAACSWQAQIPRRIFRQTVRDHEILEGEYEWGDVRYLPSWGGSMFEALMPTLVVDEQLYAPTSLGPNDVAHAVVQRRWAEEVGHFPIWGFSPSRNPAGGYREYGVPVLGSRGYDAGAVTPHAAALALAFTPAEAIANLRRMVEQYDVYGEYGLYDSIDPKSGRVARDYLALNQAMILVALANHLKPHCIQERFAADPIAQRVLPMLRDERFFE